MRLVPSARSLITSLEESGDSDALGELRSAAELASELTSLGDRVVNHFVEQARDEGHSWAEIGEALGMTKQACQQRFRLRWFERFTGRRGTPWMEFTDRARNVVEIATKEARSLDHNYIGTEHFLLAILREKGGVGAKALRDLDVTLSSVRRGIEQKIGRGEIPVSGNIPYTPKAKEALYGAREEAKALGHNYVGTEHLLLALIRLKKGVAAEILRENDVTLEEVRRSVVSLLASHNP